MKSRHVLTGVATGALALWALGGSAASAGEIQSYAPVLTGGTLIDFENLSKGTLVSNQYAGVTFSQTPSGSPMIDTYPYLFAYGAASGDNVLTGSTQGGNPSATVAGIIATFAAPKTGVQIFLSDTSPLGDYPITILGAGGSVLDTFTVPMAATLPPGYTAGAFPPPGTNPLPGVFVGFTSGSADITGIEVGPSTASGDAFAVDDLRFTSGVPEPATWAMMLTGFGLAGAALRNARRRTGAATA